MRSAAVKKRKRVVRKRATKRRAQRNPAARYFITATKKGTHYFYAGGARFTTHVRDAIRFPSVVHATTVKDQMLKDFPASLLKGTLLGIRLET